MEQKVLSRGKLLNGYGQLAESGYAFRFVKEYNRKDIRASKLKIKEWDYYYFGNNSFGFAVTVCDNGYMGLGSITFFDFEKKTYITKTKTKLLPLGKFNMPTTTDKGDVIFTSNKLNLYFINDGKSRELKISCFKFDKKNDLTGIIELREEPKETIVMATPFEKKYKFFYNHKVNCLRGKGKFTIGNRLYTFNSQDTYGVLDFGRGVWPYKSTWYWSNMCGDVDGVKVGFNLGYGFGNNQDATENILYYENHGYKIEQVTFKIPKNEKGKDEYLKEWQFTSNDKKIELTFTPLLNRNSKKNLLFIKSVQNQVFGHFNGYMMIEDKKVEIVNMLGFAEKVYNKW